MNRVFADSSYWIALLNRRDQLNEAARAAKSRITGGLVTTDEVLTEVLNFFREGGALLRGKAVAIVEGLQAAPEVEVVPQSRESFNRALALYKARPDKRFSLADCRCFDVMRQEGITEALTYDHHFVQEGFTALLRS